jgi:hypothetical protein|tara:strand:- start:9903 stop:10178 length:276 start_codon:yes stop_codon:yes gene_type:complete
LAWEQIRNKPEGFHLSIDGFQRSKKAEIELNADIAALFKTELGKKVLNYLKSITVDAVAGRDISNDQLRHLEGMRYLYFIIKKRIETHREN